VTRHHVTVQTIALETVLTVNEIELVARAAAGVGFRKIRFTGGAPTLRSKEVGS